MENSERYARQVRLAEVGDAGQARIAEAHATIAGEGLAAEVEARYLAGAGVLRIAAASDTVAAEARAVDERVTVTMAFPGEDGPTPDFGIRDPNAREVAEGAWRALDVIRRALGVPGARAT